MKRFVILALVVASGIVATSSGVRAQNVPLGILDDVAVEQHLDQELPMDLTFVDETDEPIALGSVFGNRRPVLLVPVYYECPMLCQEVLRGLVRGLKGVPFDAGIEFDVVAISFDAGESAELAASKRDEVLKQYGERGTRDGFRFWTGSQESIDRFTEAIGFRYAYDADRDEFAHASAVVMATPDGRIARYFFGLDFAPRDLRLGIVEASDGTIGGAVEALLLYCYHYDPLTGKYGVVIMNVLRLAGLITVLLLGGFILLNVRRDRDRGRFYRPAAPRRQSAERA